MDVLSGPPSKILNRSRFEFEDEMDFDVLSESISPLLPCIGNDFQRYSYRGREVDVMHLVSCIAGMNHICRGYPERVEVDEKTFTGKYILFCCFHLPSREDAYVSLYSQELFTAYKDLYSVSVDFEMVVVAKMNKLANSVEVLYDFLSPFPSSCLRLEFEDSKRRKFLCEALGVGDPGSFKCLLVNVERNIAIHGHSTVIEHMQKLFRERQMELLCCYERFVKSIWPVIPEEQKNPCLGECPIARQLNVVILEYSDEINNKVSESQKSCLIEVGKSFDAVSLLSGNGEANYLVRNNGDRFELDEKTFSGKYIMVCCFHVPIFRADYDSHYCQALATTCTDLYSTRDDFEMVVVAKMNSMANFHEAVFDHFLSGFPSSCLVVPFRDSERRNFICKYLDLVGNRVIRCLILDKDIKKNVLFYEYLDAVLDYGADAFPFTGEYVDKIRSKDKLWETPSTSKLEELLGCSPSDVLYKINSACKREQEQVTVAELSKKVVGLYLCVEEKSIPKHHKVYQECKTRQLQIEIVLVYLPYNDCLDPEAFKANIDSVLEEQKIYWWCLPFDNSVSRRLRRLRCCYDSNQVIIIGPHGAYLDPYGGEVMSCCGVDAYPFIRENLVLKEIQRVKELTLESLLVYGPRDYVRRGNETITLADLQGWNILLYLDSLDDLDFYYEVYTWYQAIKAKNPRFEVIFVRETARDLEYETKVSAMPWLVCPFDPDHSASLKKNVFTGGWHYTLVQFGTDGRICTLSAQNLLYIHGPDAFPFDERNLRQDVIAQLCNLQFYSDFLDYGRFEPVN